MRPSHLSVIAFVTASCVSSARYDALQKQLDESQANLIDQTDDRDRKIASLERRGKELEEALATAQAAAKDDAAVRERIDQQRILLQAQLATVVRDKAALKEAADELRAALAASDRRRDEAWHRVREMRRLLVPLQAMIDARTLEVKIVDGRMVLVLGTDILFPTGSAELSDAGRVAIDEVAKALLLVPDRRVQIEGHTDSVPIHNAHFRSNWELGAARAITIVNTMAHAGVNVARLSGATFADERPVSTNATDTGRAMNRRIEIVIVPDLSQLPGSDELRQAVEGQ